MSDELLFWIYFIVIFGIAGGVTYLFMRKETKKEKKEDVSEKRKKNIAEFLVALVFSYIIAVMIKFVRGAETPFWVIYPITFIITYAIMLYLIKRKEEKK